MEISNFAALEGCDRLDLKTKDLLDTGAPPVISRRARRALGVVVCALLLPSLTPLTRQPNRAGVGDRAAATDEQPAAAAGQAPEDADSDGLDDRVES